jgi:hypothetical protein
MAGHEPRAVHSPWPAASLGLRGPMGTTSSASQRVLGVHTGREHIHAAAGDGCGPNRPRSQRQRYSEMPRSRAGLRLGTAPQRRLASPPGVFGVRSLFPTMQGDSMLRPVQPDWRAADAGVSPTARGHSGTTKTACRAVVHSRGCSVGRNGMPPMTRRSRGVRTVSPRRSNDGLNDAIPYRREASRVWHQISEQPIS